MLHPTASRSKADSRVNNASSSTESAPHPLNGTVPVKGAVASAGTPLASLHQTLGNQAVLRSLSPSRPPLQPKLAVNTPGDPHEQEADRVADQVMRTPEPARPAPNSTAGVQLQRKCDCGGTCSQCQSDAAEPISLQKKRSPEHAASPSQVPDSVHSALRSSGRPLDAQTRAFMEPRFGDDLGNVRVHTGRQAEDSAKDIHARAYTVGRDIVFGSGQYQPGTPDGNRLLAHELTHVRQQSTGAVLRSVVQRYPDKDDWSLLENTFAGEPRFVFWAKKHGKPPVTYIEQMNLLDQYNLVKDTKDVLEEFDRAQTGRDKSMLEARRQRARAAEERSAATKHELAAQQRIGERKRNRPFLDQAIEKALKERWRYNSTEWAKQARFDLHHYVRLQEGLVREHFPSPEHRWVYIYYYITEYYGMEASSIDVSMVVPDLREQEEIYLENSAKGADASELSMFRKGVPQAARSARIRKLAETQPMNPVDNFEPGIHDYSPYPGQPQSVDMDIVGGDFDSDELTVKYSDGKEIQIPLTAKPDLFSVTPVNPQNVLKIFNRRHRSSGRLVPFVIYEDTLGINNLDVLSEEDLALLGLPRFDPALTPAVMYFLSTDFKARKLSLGILEVAKLHALGLGFRQLGVPAAAGGIRTASAVVSGGLRSGSALLGAAVRQVSFAVDTYGYSSVTASYLGRTAFTYYLANAVEINTAALVGTDMAINLAGGDTGGVTVGDEMSMVVADAQAIAKGSKEWKVIEGEVEEVDLVSKEVRLRITKVEGVSEKAAKEEYDLGRKLALLREPRGKGKVKLGVDPRPEFDVNEFNRIRTQLQTQLPKLDSKFRPAALRRLANLNADQLKEAQIHPSDLEKLYKKLNSAGNTTREFINNFHDAPNFEQVILNWAKSKVWIQTRNAKPNDVQGFWKSTQSMRSGTNFLMKYCVSNLKGRNIRFEWPAGIKDMSWGEEIWARYVDVVVEDGSRVKPGQSVNLELKSWTEFTLRNKAASPRGVQFQLTRDTALWGPDNIRWVFDGTKVSKKAVMAEFLKVIKGDPYLREKWGSDDNAISDALDRVIEVFQNK